VPTQFFKANQITAFKKNIFPDKLKFHTKIFFSEIISQTTVVPLL